MDFAFCPEKGYPRVMRYVSSEAMPTPTTITTLDREQNVLVINKPIFDRLLEMDRHRVLRTQKPILTAIVVGDHVPEVIW